MRSTRALRRWVALAICVAMLVACAGAVAETFYYGGSVTIGSTADPGSAFISRYQLYDALDAEIPLDDGVPFDDSIGELLDECEDGAIAADKDGYFATEDDAKNGIVKLTIDVVGKTPAEAVDVMFVLDESGSMAMYAALLRQGHNTMPCLNPDHFYKIIYQYVDKDGVLHENLIYDLWPNEIAEVNCWAYQESIDAIEAQIQADIPAEHFPITDFSLPNYAGGYDFGDNHYKKVDGNDVKIPKTGAFDESLGITNSGQYYSPDVNDPAYDGCTDRQLIAKAAIRDMAQEIMDSTTTASYIGYVGFAGLLTASRAMDHSVPATDLDRLNGYNATNYMIALVGEVGVDGVHGVAGAKGAQKLLEDRLNGQNGVAQKRENQQTIVVFITDGVPNQPRPVETSGQAGIDAAQRIKDMANTTLYCVGIRSSAQDLLAQMASPGCFKECDTLDEFTDFLRDITATINAKPAHVVDVLGDGYDLVCDAEHPITVQHGTGEGAEKSYTTVAQAADGGVTVQGSTVTWDIENANTQGSRLSFYAKLTPELLSGPLASYTGAFPTNRNATTDYTRVSETDPLGVPEQRSLPNPATLRVEQSRLRAVKTSDRPGQVVWPGEEIGYTITLQNTGVLDLSDLSVLDTLPAETQYVPGSGGTLADGAVRFAVPALQRGASTSVSFRARVLSGTHDIQNYAMFGTGNAAASMVDGLPACYANLVVNPRAAQSTVPQTGDGARPLLWAALLGLSALVWVGMIVYGRKRRGA